MRVAIRTGSTFGRALVDEKGQLTGEHSGLAIVRRLLKLWPDPILVTDQAGSGEWQCDGFVCRREDQLDVNDTVIVNMDVVDSMALHRELRRDSWRLHPKIVNLVWWNTSEWTDDIERQELALSTALFPTFCNSERTELEIRELHRRHLTPYRQSRAVVEHQNLGFPQPQREAVPDEDPPVVMYPAMWLFARKNPGQFAQVVERVAKRVPIQVEMRLHPKAFPHEVAEMLTEQPWADVDLLAPKDEYWDLLERTTAFLATAQDESYGLQYLEALWAGQIGVFPRRPWAENILPPGYPFLYENLQQAETMLHLAVTKPDDARLMMDRAFGELGMRGWLRANHSEEDFDSELQLFMERQFPDLAGDSDEG